MWKNDSLVGIQNLLLQDRLGKAVTMFENYLLTYPQRFDTGQLIDIKNNYQLLVDYWRKGFDDPRRNQLYKELSRRLFVLLNNVLLTDRMAHSSFFMQSYQHSSVFRRSFSISGLKASLESFVTNIAMLELEPEHLRQSRKSQLYAEHQQLQSNLFDYLITSEAMTDWQKDEFLDLLLSPTVDSFDQQLIVSALMLSAMMSFDMNKFHLLTSVYRLTTDEQLRQRALVGWVFAADADKASLYPEMHEIVSQLCSDEQCLNELTELQIQIVYCMQADNDSQTIKSEIMPDLIKGNNIRITRQGIVEMEEDKLEDILHPDSTERNMERMEASMRKMADMQRRGSDIYFAGFSQMKRFPFFSTASNWFLPFYPQHPGIAHIWNQSKGQRFLHLITSLGAFCDSDKYSFVLAFEQVLSHLPAQMLQMVENGEATPMAIGGEVPNEEQSKPAFMRRMYLQNLYRFFRLYSYRSEFINPFESSLAIIFSNKLFNGTPLEAHFPEVVSFLMKRKMQREAISVLQNISEQQRGFQYYLVMGQLRLAQKVNDGLSATACFKKALALEPDNEQALRGYARSLYSEQRYDEALDAFERLLTLKPDNRSIELNVAVCLIDLKRYDEALKLLYKLNYEEADDERVNRVLAWCLTLLGKYEQALKIYESLLASDKPSADDLLNNAFCLWFKKDVAGAENLFRRLLSQQADSEFSLENELLVVEHALLLEHGLTDIDIHLMLDLLAA